MRSLLPCLLAALAPALAQAQPAPARAASAPAPQVRVIEDDGARIEETVLNGQLQRVRVQSKLGNVRPYEIVVPRPGRDPSQDEGAAGRRVWSVLTF